MLQYLQGYKGKPKAQQPGPSSTPDKKRKDKEYEKKRERVYLQKWERGRDWLKNTDQGMVCTYCQESTSVLRQMRMHLSKQFISGCPSYRVESIVSHEDSDSHKEAEKIHQRQLKPDESEGHRACNQLNMKNYPKIKIMFQTCHAIAKHQRPFRDFVMMIKMKGLTTYSMKMR